MKMFFIQISQNTELYFCTQPSILWIVKNLYMYFMSPDSSSFSRKSLCKKLRLLEIFCQTGKKPFVRQNKDLSEAANSSRLNSSRCDNHITALNL